MARRPRANRMVKRAAPASAPDTRPERRKGSGERGRGLAHLPVAMLLPGLAFSRCADPVPAWSASLCRAAWRAGSRPRSGRPAPPARSRRATAANARWPTCLKPG